MKKSTLKNINKKLESQEITQREANNRAQTAYKRAAKKHLLQTGAVEDAFNSIDIQVPNPLTSKGHVIARLIHNSNPYSDPGLFFSTHINIRKIKISKKSLLV